MQVSVVFLSVPKIWLNLSQKVIRICSLAEAEWRELHFCMQCVLVCITSTYYPWELEICFLLLSVNFLFSLCISETEVLGSSLLEFSVKSKTTAMALFTLCVTNFITVT